MVDKVTTKLEYPWNILLILSYDKMQSRGSHVCGLPLSQAQPLWPTLLYSEINNQAKDLIGCRAQENMTAGSVEIASID